MKALTESDIVRQICDYLAAKRCMFWRSNNIPVYDSTRDTFRRMPKYSMKGVPDIIVIDGGHFIGLEVKMPKGVQSNDQKIFQRLLEDAGGSYHLVRDTDDLIKLGL